MYNELFAFIKLMETRSFIQTAKYCNCNQSTISRYINKIETQLNLTLVKRNSRTVQPTWIGKYLYNRLKSYSHEINSVMKDVVNLHNGQVGTLKILIPEFLSTSNFARQITLFQTNNINLEIFFKSGPINMNYEEFDMVITNYLPTSQDSFIKKLCTQSMKLFTSIETAEQYGIPQDINEIIRRYNILGYLGHDGQPIHRMTVYDELLDSSQIIDYQSTIFTNNPSYAIHLAKEMPYVIGVWDMLISEVPPDKFISILPNLHIFPQTLYLVKHGGQASALESELGHFIESYFRNCCMNKDTLLRE